MNIPSIITTYTLFFCLSILSLSAQGIMSFEKETHDFGTIKEGEVATYEFIFTNTGDQPIEIATVKASCGCTTPFWTRELIKPGEKGSIKASYNSKDRPGGFSKSITVQSNAKRNVTVLYIKGFAEPAQSSTQSDQGQQYVETVKQSAFGKTKTPASIRIDKEEFDFGSVKTGQVIRQRFNIYNAGQENLIITGFDKQCDCVSFGVSSSVIGPNQTGILEIALEAKRVQELEEDFVLITNDAQNPSRAIRLKAKIYEDFSQHLFKNTSDTAPFEK